MPEKKTVARAKKKLRQGKSPSTAAGELVRQEIEHVREGKHGARSPEQAIAIGLEKARRAGIPVGPRRKAGKKTRRAAPKRGGRAAVSRRALSRHAKASARRRSKADRSRAAKKAAATRRRSTGRKRRPQTNRRRARRGRARRSARAS
jgi:hypothetical protein